jgi:hypothetical protein
MASAPAPLAGSGPSPGFGPSHLSRRPTRPQPEIYNWPPVTTSPISTTSLPNSLSLPFENSDEKVSDEGNEIWRHIDNYCLYQIPLSDEQPNRKKKKKLMEEIENKQMASLLVDISQSAIGSKKNVLVGSILPNPSNSSSHHPIYVEIVIINYAIDFGHSREDNNRGLWLHGLDSIWYKLENPRLDYSDLADECLILCSQYINFYDAIVYGVGAESKMATLNTSFLYKCEYDVETVYKKSEFHFDINILRTNCQFFYERSSPLFTSGCKLMKDLKVDPTD